MNWKTQESYGEMARRARRKKDLTQRQLADKSGVSVQTIGNIEREERSPSLLTLSCICDVLGISIDEYVGYEVKAK